MIKKILFLLMGFLPIALHAQLSGNYTINPSLPASATNYQSFTTAIAALNAPTGISAAVTFTVSAATYTGQYTLNAVVGASAVNRITFVKAAGVNRPVLTFAATSGVTDYILRLDDTDYLTLDGLNIEPTSTTNECCIDFFRVANVSINKTNNGITIQNCQFTSATNISSLSCIMGANFYDTATPSASNNTRISDLLISNNLFIGFDRTIYLQGVVSNANTGNQLNGYNNISIIGNQIYPGSFMTADNPIILSGINSGEISNNTIWSYAGGIGLSSTYGEGGTIAIYNNTINASVNNDGIVSIQPKGIHLVDCENTTVNIYNNSISVQDGLYPTNIYGIYIENITGIVNVFNNTISLYSSDGGTVGYGFSTSSSTLNTGILRVHNNIIKTNGLGAGLVVFPPVGNSGLGTPNIQFNYNDYFGGSLLAIWFGTQHTTMASLRAASGMDAQSISADPLLVITATGGYRIGCGSPCLDAGTNVQVLPAATTDIVGNPRIQNTTVDMGAFEILNGSATAAITKSNDLACGVNAATLTATGSGTYLWSNNSANNAITVNTAGVYTVTVTNTAACGATTATATVLVSMLNTGSLSPVITVTGTTCPKTLTATGGASYLWSTSAATATISAAMTNTYTVTASSSTGCSGTATVTVDCCNLQITELRTLIYVHAQAVTFPTPTITGCAAGSTLTYLWEFGDGTTSTLASPTKTYTSIGNYTVCLTVTCTATNGTYCRAKCCRAVNIGKNCPTLYPTFAVNTPATGLVYTFTGTIQSASVVPAPVSTYEIYKTLGNILVTTLTGTNATYTFPAADEYTVCRNLAYTTDATYGTYCTNKNCRKITVMPTAGCNAAAKFVATTYKANPLNVTFNASSYSTGASAYYWEYSTSPTGAFAQLGTATNAALGIPTFLFPSTGIYWVRLTLNKGTACETGIIVRINLNSFSCTSSSTTTPAPANRTVNPDGSIEVGNSDINDGIGLYPNPADSHVIVTFGNDIKATTLIKVFDMKGQLVTSFRTQDGDSQAIIDLANQSAGMYLFHIENENGERLVKKVMKQ
ncbi:MAG: hypothetical protein RI894_1509 [Bacteroidota bacterium]|jgi:PKD repeat protein